MTMKKTTVINGNERLSLSFLLLRISAMSDNMIIYRMLFMIIGVKHLIQYYQSIGLVQY